MTMSRSNARLFRRYSGNTHLFLKKGPRSFEAKFANYAVNGVCVRVEGSPQILKGDIVHLLSDIPRFNAFGEVVWSKSDNGKSVFGIKIKGRLHGFLRDFRLPGILIGLQRSNKTGILTVTSGDIIKNIFIRNGNMIFSSSNQDEDRLGDLLLREHIITQMQFDQSVTGMKQTGERQGTVLVRLGYLDPGGLARAVRFQVEEIIRSMLPMTEGSFVFEEVPFPPEVITLHLSAANLIYHGMKKAADIETIMQEMPPPDSVLDFSPEPFDLFQYLALDDAGKQIVASVNGTASLREVISVSGLTEHDAVKSIHALLSVMMLEIRSPETNGSGLSGISAAIKEEILADDTGSGVDHGIKAEIEDMHRRYQSLGYYGVLGVRDHVPAEAIKLAYYKAAKKFHPDMHFHYADDSLKSKLSDIFSYIYEAYATLSDYGKRKEYDKMITIKPASLSAAHDRAREKFEAGKAQMKRNNLADAELLFGQAVYFDKTIADHHFYYGVSLNRQEKFRDAEKALDDARRLEPRNAEYLAELGFAYLGMGFPARAKGLFAKALELSPGNQRAAEGMMKAGGKMP